MQKKILAIGICALMLIVVFSSGCVAEKEKGIMEEETEEETTESPLRLQIYAYNSGTETQTVCFYINDEWESSPDAEPDWYASISKDIYEPGTIELSIYVGDTDAYPPWVDETQWRYYSGSVYISSEDIANQHWKTAYFYFDDNDGCFAETSIIFEVYNWNNYGINADLYIDNNFIDSLFIDSDDVRIRLVPNIGVGSRKVSIYADGEWQEETVNVTQVGLHKGLRDESYVIFDVETANESITLLEPSKPEPKESIPSFEVVYLFAIIGIYAILLKGRKKKGMVR